MRDKVFRVASSALACVSLLTSGCGGAKIDIWPFSGASEQERSRTPTNALAYQCEGGKRLYVRYLENGSGAWVILPEREFRLDKAVSASGARYSNGGSTLEVKDNEAVLSDGAAITHAGCKVAGS
jgi:membrane-bound inhibitor of C-type lysozyme